MISKIASIRLFGVRHHSSKANFKRTRFNSRRHLAKRAKHNWATIPWPKGKNIPIAPLGWRNVHIPLCLWPTLQLWMNVKFSREYLSKIIDIVHTSKVINSSRTLSLLLLCMALCGYVIQNLNLNAKWEYYVNIQSRQ